MVHLDSPRPGQDITRSYFNDTRSLKTIDSAEDATIVFNLAAFPDKKKGCLLCTIIFAVFSQLTICKTTK